MKRFGYIVIGVLAFIIAGCGQDITTTLKNKTAPTNGPGTGSTIVILPFADYSTGHIDSAQRRSMFISESFTDTFTRYGFSTPIAEDVFAYLVKEQLIQLSAANKAIDTTSLNNEIASHDWSETMRSEIIRYRNETTENAVRNQRNSLEVHSLTPDRVAKMGRHFKADYVLRGRILEFKTRNEARWEPWKKGILPFIFGGTNRIINGFARPEQYDTGNRGLTAMMLGGSIAHNGVNWPWNKEKSILGMVDGSANTITWMASSYAVESKLANTGGDVDQAVVQMRVWVQETSRGNVVWTNRVRVAVSPESVLADNQYDLLFNRAIEKAAFTLSEDFISCNF